MKKKKILGAKILLTIFLCDTSVLFYNISFVTYFSYPRDLTYSQKAGSNIVLSAKKAYKEMNADFKRPSSRGTIFHKKNRPGLERLSIKTAKGPDVQLFSRQITGFVSMIF